jgi:tetratricopeptide (TPR) repeat protein
MRAVAIVVCAGALFLCLPPVTEAQDDPRLSGALALARDGSADSARAVVGGLLATIPPTDTLYAEALYTAGSIAGSAQDMQRYFQRIAIEYAWSPWADDALLRLAQIDFAANDQSGAVRNLEAIRQDYPGSPLLPTAALWAARAHFVLDDSRAACDWLGEGLAAVGNDIELKNRLDFYHRRCGPGTVSLPDSALREERPPAAQAPAAGQGEAAAGPVLRVQVLATRSRQAADDFLPQVTPLGYPTEVVAEGEWFKVRVGPFTDRVGAQAAVERIKRQIGGNPFVVHEP